MSDIQKEYLDLNNNFSYHKASDSDWRGIGYMEIPSGADIYFMEWFYKEIQEGKWLVWDKHQDSWKPCDYDFREDCPNIHWKREGVTLKKALDKSTSNQTVPEGFVLVEASEFESLKSDNEHFTKSCIDWTDRAYKQRAKVDHIKNEVERFKQSGTNLDLSRFLDNLIEFSTFKHDKEFDGFVLVPRELSDEEARKHAEVMFKKAEHMVRNELRDLSESEFESFKNRWIDARTRIIQFDWKAMIEVQVTP